jgi:hypothetical protein
MGIIKMINPKIRRNQNRKPGGISTTIENLLDAVNNEKENSDKVNAQKVQGKPVKTEKTGN